jgi:hypothetical protein
MHDGIDQFPVEPPPRFKESLPSPNALIPRCSPWLAELVVTMTAKDPSRRFSSLEKVIDKLAAAPAEDLGLVRVSYERCLQQNGSDAFFARVYARKKALPDHEWLKFRAKIEWSEQHENLSEAIERLGPHARVTFRSSCPRAA